MYILKSRLSERAEGEEERGERDHKDDILMISLLGIDGVSTTELPWDAPTSQCPEYCEWCAQNYFFSPWTKISNEPLGTYCIMCMHVCACTLHVKRICMHACVQGSNCICK